MRNIRRFMVRGAVALLLGSTAASAAFAEDMCITDLALTQGEDNFQTEQDDKGNVVSEWLKVGYWDVRGGSGNASSTSLGAGWVSLSAKVDKQSSRRCITEIKTVNRNDGQPAKAPLGFSQVGYWGVNTGLGSVDTDGLFLKGTMWLYVKRMDPKAVPSKVVSDAWIHVDAGNNAHMPAGYAHAGRWHVDTAGGASSKAVRETGCNDSTCAAGVATLSYATTPFTQGEDRTGEVQSAVLVGSWKKIGSCAGKDLCSLSRDVSIGASRELSKVTVDTTSKTLGVTVGASAKTTTGAFPGGEIEASIEVSGEISNEFSTELSDALTTEYSENFNVSCGGAASLWQWVSTLQINVYNMSATNITIGSPDYICAGANEGPPSLTDYSWKKKFLGEDDDAAWTTSWTRCAGENETCTVTGPSTVRYGADGKYNSKSVNAPVVCSNGNFGDAAPGVVKSCEFISGSWTDCAGENQSCAFEGSRLVRFGAGTQWTEKVMTGPASCSNSVFGDPAPNVAKRCEVAK